MDNYRDFDKKALPYCQTEFLKKSLNSQNLQYTVRIAVSLNSRFLVLNKDATMACLMASCLIDINIMIKLVIENIILCVLSVFAHRVTSVTCKKTNFINHFYQNMQILVMAVFSFLT